MYQLVWAEMKDLIDRYKLDHGREWVWLGSEGLYKIFASPNDGSQFLCNLNKDGGADQLDFEANYKDQPFLETYFSGSGDDSGIGLGPRLLFDMLATDASKQIDLEYDQIIFLKDVLILCENAPLGAYLDINAVNSGGTVVGSFGRKIPILNGSQVALNTERIPDDGIATNLKIRTIVYNSDGTGEQDAAAAFKVAVNFELYRNNTV